MHSIYIYIYTKIFKYSVVHRYSMGKRSLQLYIETEIIDIIQAKYPKRISELVEKFFQSLINQEQNPFNEQLTYNKAIEEISDLTAQQEEITIKLNSLKVQLKQLEFKSYGLEGKWEEGKEVKEEL